MDHRLDEIDPDLEPQHKATYQRTFGVPSAPKIFVPPPMLNSAEAESALSEKFIQAEANPSFKNTEFLNTKPASLLRPKSHVLDWRYSHRHEAQPIIAWLFLGPLAAAKNKAWLQENKITFLLSVRKTSTLMSKLLAPKAPQELGISMAHIDVTGNQELIATFPRAIDMINEHLNEISRAPKADNEEKESGKVLVFCESGNDRSAAVVAAYLMAMFDVNAVQAMQAIQAERFCVSLDDELRYLLDSYSEILKAMKDVKNQIQANANKGLVQDSAIEAGGRNNLSAPSLNSSMGRKRSVASLYDDEDEEMGDAPDDVSFRREASAPFLG